MSTSGASHGFAATLALVRAVRGSTWGKTPKDAREVEGQCPLDFLGCAVAGSREPLSNILVNEIVKGEASSEASLIGRKQRSTRLTAGLVNGAVVHALDFDDKHISMSGEIKGANGRTLLESIIAGIEMDPRADALDRDRITHRS